VEGEGVEGVDVEEVDIRVFVWLGLSIYLSSIS
jgi:hypothetical protein